MPVFRWDVLWYGTVHLSICLSISCVRKIQNALFRIIWFLDTRYISTYLWTILKTTTAVHSVCNLTQFFTGGRWVYVAISDCFCLSSNCYQHKIPFCYSLIIYWVILHQKPSTQNIMSIFLSFFPCILLFWIKLTTEVSLQTWFNFNPSMY